VLGLLFFVFVVVIFFNHTHACRIGAQSGILTVSYLNQNPKFVFSITHRRVKSTHTVAHKSCISNRHTNFYCVTHNIFSFGNFKILILGISQQNYFFYLYCVLLQSMYSYVCHFGIYEARKSINQPVKS
jgi:hypothetical protein